MADNVFRRIKEAIGSLIDKGTHLDAAEAAEHIAEALGLSPRLINYTHIELRNELNKLRFSRSKPSERILFLPHCLKNSEKCKATYNEEGLQCKKCGSCQIPELIELGKKAGYSKIFVTPGGSMVQKLIKKYKPKAALGVCCYDEANMAFDKLQKTSVVPQAVLLLKDGCKDTAVNLEEAKEKLFLGNGNGFEGNFNKK